MATQSEIVLLMDIATFLRTLPSTTTTRSLLARIEAVLGDIPTSSRIATDVPMRI